LKLRLGKTRLAKPNTKLKKLNIFDYKIKLKSLSVVDSKSTGKLVLKAKLD